MSVRTAYFAPSLMSPIATPATAERSGTPASKSASDPPHTDAIDDEPFDSRMSDTMRIVYGKSSNAGSTLCSARSARFPCPISRRLVPRIGLTSPVENGGEVALGQDGLLLLPGGVVLCGRVAHVSGA